MSRVYASEQLSQIRPIEARVLALEHALHAALLRQQRFRLNSRVTLGVFAMAVAASALAYSAAGLSLQQFIEFSSVPATIPPLDTSVRWSRTDPKGVPPGHTNELLSLIAEADQANSYTWPLYIQLTGTNSPAATQASSQSAGASVRAFQRSTGSPWLVGYHSEAFHGLDGRNGPVVAANGTTILYNGELTSKATGGSTIGLNLQNAAGSTVRGTHAIQIQPGAMGWSNGIYFDSGASGNIGVNFGAATFAVGIDLGNNSLRLNGNQKLVLEKYGQVFIRYNTSNDKVEIVKGGRTVVAAW